MITRVEKFLKENNFLETDAKFILAFSGGFDSMALAHVMYILSQKYGFKLILAHLNHNWRGEKALLEQENCENFAKSFGIDIYTDKLDENLPHTETVAREMRYKFLFNLANKLNVRNIITPHTKSDNIETLLQRIIKGTSVSGLACINSIRKENNIILIRPMLDISRDEILDYCNQNSLFPNNDESNFDTKYERNKIRNELIPYLKNYNPNIEDVLNRLIIHAKENEEVINSFLEPLYEKSVNNTMEFSKLSKPIKQKILKKMLIENGLDYDFKKINEILNFIEENKISKSGKTLSLTSNLWLFVSVNNIELLTQNDYNEISAETKVNNEGIAYLKEFDVTLKIEEYKGNTKPKFPKETENFIYADLSSIRGDLYFRTRKNGDKIVPLGMNEQVKLKKYLNNKKCSKHEKSKVLLLSTEKEVLWICNLGISNNIRVKNLPTHKIEILYKRS